MSIFADVASTVRGAYTRGRGIGLALVTGLSFLLLINSSWKAIPDGALYLELGQSVARGTGYIFNGEPHTYAPPGYPAMVAASAVALGESFLSYRILMAVLGLLAAGAAYILMYRLVGPDLAFLAGGLFAINHVLLENSTFTSSDVPFALTVFVSMNAVVSLAGEKQGLVKIVLVGLITGLPALVRVNGLGLPPAAVFYLVATSNRKSALGSRVLHVAVFLVAAYAPTLTWEAYKSSFPQSFQEGTYLYAISGRSLQTQAEIIVRALWEYVHETSFALTGVSMKTGVVELIIPALALLGLIKAFRRGERLLVPLTVIQYCGLLLSPAGSRYLIFLIPSLYLFVALGIFSAWSWFTDWSGGRPSKFLSTRIVIFVCFLAMAVTNYGHNLVTIVQARTALETEGAESARDLPFFVAGRWLRDTPEKGVLMSMHPRILHHISGLPTIELVRSGVPEQDVWVDKSQQIQDLVVKRHPAYFFSDVNNQKLYNQVLTALNSLGFRLVPVEETEVSPRFRLWRIVTMR